MGRCPKLLLSVCVLVLGLIGAELAFRVYLESYADEDRFRRFASIAQLQRSERFPSEIERHVYLGYIARPGFQRRQSKINSLGFRGPEITQPKPPDEFRIACIGGSTTWGAHSYEESYPGHLEKALRSATGRNVRVVNAGMKGWTSYESFINVAFRVLELQPDLVIVYHGINDIHPRWVWPPELYSGDNSPYRTAGAQVHWPRLFEHSSLLRAWAVSTGRMEPHARIETFFGGRGPGYIGFDPDGPVSPAEVLAANPPVYFQRNLENLSVIAQHAGAQVLFLSFAHCTGFENRYQSSSQAYKTAFAEMNAATKRASENTGAHFFPFADHFPDDRAHFNDEVHMTPEALVLMGNLVAEHLLSARLLE